MLPAPRQARRKLPNWVVLLVVLATGAFTVWAMSETRLRGPVVAWEHAHAAVDGVWGAEPPDPSALEHFGKPVASALGIPPIVGGTPLAHADRGVCTSCHAVVGPQGGAVPGISATSTMTHEYRGICSNCHQFRGAASRASGSPMLPATPIAQAPSEAEWLGLEIGPAPQGVVIQGVEGLAARRGVLPSDHVASLNGIPIRSIADFLRATQNGMLAQGTLIVLRGGRRLAFELGANAETPPPAPPPPPAAPLVGGPAEVQF
jgi:hypothetical protein